MFFTQKIVKKPHFTVAHTVILKSKSIKNFLSYESQKNFIKVLVLKVKSDFVNDNSNTMYTEIISKSVIIDTKLFSKPRTEFVIIDTKIFSKPNNKF